VSIPNNLKDALGNPKWKEAMCEEMTTLQKNKTLYLVELPVGKKTVECKWVFAGKHKADKADGSIERYKARLVAKSFTQTYGIDHSLKSRRYRQYIVVSTHSDMIFIYNI